MAGTKRRTNATVEERLFEEPYRFEFYQAVRLLELLHPEATSVGAGSDPAREAVRFRASPSLGFPASDVAGMVQSSINPVQMTTTFLGLAGSVGPLPRPWTELILERVARKDTAARDFLDIFNHRLIALLYRAKAKHRLNLGARAPQETPVASYLYSLLGLGTPGLRGRLNLPDRALLHYAGLLSQKPRSAIGLQQLLSDYFKIPVVVKQFVARWQQLESDQWTKLGQTGQNRTLGHDVVLGTRIWDQHAAVELQLGPLDPTTFKRFLPAGSSWKALADGARFYLGIEIVITVRLLLATGAMTPLRLSADDPPRLGWTTWLRGAEANASPDQQVVLEIPPN